MKRIHINTEIGNYDKINNLNLRSDLENNNIFDCYLEPQGSISADGIEESYAIDCFNGEGSSTESYLYNSAHEYCQDLAILGLDSFVVNYDNLELNIYFEGEEFVRDLNEGDVGDFWHSLETKNGVIKDVNFAQEDAEEEPCLSLYKIVDNSTIFGSDTDISFGHYIAIGDIKNYFDKDVVPYNPTEDTTEKKVWKPTLLILGDMTHLNEATDGETKTIINNIVGISYLPTDDDACKVGEQLIDTSQDWACDSYLVPSTFKGEIENLSGQYEDIIKEAQNN